MRIAIVNDMLLALEALRRTVAGKPGWKIAWTARDGAEAAKKCAADVPDVILMDLIMPVMNGAEATRQIMRDSPCAILVVTATVEGNMQLVFEAMGHGALDAINTPVLGMDGKLSGAAELIGKIEIIGKLIGKGKQHAPALVAIGEPVADNRHLQRLRSGRNHPHPSLLPPRGLGRGAIRVRSHGYRKKSVSPHASDTRAARSSRRECR